MDNNLLKQLISRHKRVVVPDFGAFLKKEDAGGDILAFSPFLRKDDGVVTDAIVREYGVETDDARAMVAEFVAYLKQSLAQSQGRYYIEGVGMLVTDANGTIVLKEHEIPKVVLAEPVPVQPIPQSVPQVSEMPQVVTRAQSIQVQAPVAHPMQSFPGILQQQQIPPSQQRNSMPQGGYPGVQQPIRAQYQPPRSPMMAQPLNFQQNPIMGGGQPPMGQQYMSGQQPMPQPMHGGGQQAPPSIVQQPIPTQPMAHATAEQPTGGGAPPREPQDPRRMGMSNGERPNNAMKQNVAGEQQRRRRPPQGRRKPQKKKTKADVWLIIAIMSAMVVIALMIYAVLTDKGGADSMAKINAAMAPIVDTTVSVSPSDSL